MNMNVNGFTTEIRGIWPATWEGVKDVARLTRAEKAAEMTAIARKASGAGLNGDQEVRCVALFNAIIEEVKLLITDSQEGFVLVSKAEEAKSEIVAMELTISKDLELYKVGIESLIELSGTLNAKANDKHIQMIVNPKPAMTELLEKSPQLKEYQEDEMRLRDQIKVLIRGAKRKDAEIESKLDPEPAFEEPSKLSDALLNAAELKKHLQKQVATLQRVMHG